MKTSSKTIKFPLTQNNFVNITITKKHMKNMLLKISKDIQIKLSIPYRVSYAYAYKFLVNKRDWIITEINKINSNLSYTKCNFKDGGDIFLLGCKFPLNIETSTKNKVVFSKKETTDANTNYPQTHYEISNPFENHSFTIFTKPNADIKNIFTAWCKKYFLEFFTNRLNYLYSKLFKDSRPPITKIKIMKSMWGNCNFSKRIITLNLYLAKTPISCIDYVIVHELTHLIYPNHGKDFYNALTKIMPDWKLRKKVLNNYCLSF